MWGGKSKDFYLCTGCLPVWVGRNCCYKPYFPFLLGSTKHLNTIHPFSGLKNILPICYRDFWKISVSRNVIMKSDSLYPGRLYHRMGNLSFPSVLSYQKFSWHLSGKANYENLCFSIWVLFSLFFEISTKGNANFIGSCSHHGGGL